MDCTDVNNAVCWDLMTCVLVDIHRRYGKKCCVTLRDTRDSTVLEASVGLHQTARCHTAEDNTLHSLEKLKSHINCDFHVRSNLAGKLEFLQGVFLKYWKRASLSNRTLDARRTSRCWASLSIIINIRGGGDLLEKVKKDLWDDTSHEKPKWS